MKNLILSTFVLLLCLQLARPVSAADAGAAKSIGGDAAKKVESTQAVRPPDATHAAGELNINDLILLDRSSRSAPPLIASPDEPTITRLTAELLRYRHYRHQSLNDDISSHFLDRYLEMLDPLRVHFLQSDLKEFDKYRTELDDLVKEGDTRPAREVFRRFLQRVEERVAFVAELLKTEKFEFAGDDRISLDRRKAPYPKDPAEARQLWRQHLRYEYLQEKLNWKKPADPAARKKDAPEKTDKPGEAAVKPGETLHEEIVKTIAKRYGRSLRFWREFDGADVFQTYLTALANVYDPHSDYMGKATLENFAMHMSLSLFGIGAVLQSEDGYCKVKELKPGPAMHSKKIKPGDRIVSVAQGDDEPVDVVDMKLAKVVEMIRGAKGTKVRLKIIPVDAADPGERVEVSLVRDEIKLEDEQAKAKVIEVPGKDGKSTRLGIIDLPSFYASFDLSEARRLQAAGNGERPSVKSTTADVARLLKKLKEENIAGVVLDLRRNGGGALDEAVNLTGLFIKEGPVVQVRDSSGEIIVDSDTDPEVQYDGPLIVLTSRFSASASEILAGALQDYGRALIVGDSSTHGKGTVQSLIQLEPLVSRVLNGTTNNPGALKITVRKFYRASGSSTQLKGVTPDIILPSINNYADVGEAASDYALPWDTIRSARFEKLDRIRPLLPELRNRSGERVAADKDFEYVREDIEQYRKYLADKSVTLNEDARRQEKKDNEERLEARKKERHARHDPEEKVYELTLNQVDQPGLQAPVANAEDDSSKSRTEVTAAHDADLDEEDAEDKTQAADPALKETKRILLDLIALSSHEAVVVGKN
jgi:carboxyl-terminal processing protease